MGGIDVSIIVPMFNAAAYVDALIESVMAQSFSNWELIMVDDRSSDDTVQRAETAKGNDPRIHVCRRPEELPKGGDVCRNYGMDMARGKYLFFVDADDIIAPYCLRQRFDLMEKSPEVDCGVFPALTFNHSVLDNPKAYFGFKFGNPINGLINKVLPFVVWNNMYRHDSLKNRKLRWDEKLMSSQDSDFNIQCLVSGLKYHGFDAVPDYFWRQSQSLSTKIKSNAHAENNLYYFEKINSLFGSRNEYDADMRLFSYWVFTALYHSRNRDIINRFLGSDFFASRRLLRLKYDMFERAGSMVGAYSHRVTMLLLLIWFPKLFMRRRCLRHEWPWGRKYKENLKELVARCKREYGRN